MKKADYLKVINKNKIKRIIINNYDDYLSIL